MAYPAARVSRGKPPACLHFINVQSLNYNLKSVARSLQPAFAPVQRVSPLSLLSPFFTILLRWAAITVRRSAMLDGVLLVKGQGTGFWINNKTNPVCAVLFVCLDAEHEMHPLYSALKIHQNGHSILGIYYTYYIIFSSQLIYMLFRCEVMNNWVVPWLNRSWLCPPE